MKIQVLLAAAGLGTRLKAGQAKALIPLKGKPLFCYSLEIFEKSNLIESVIIMVPQGEKEPFQEEVDKHGFKKVKEIVAGGERRCDSVLTGLQNSDDDTEFVVIHDAARPFITEDLLSKVIIAAQENKAAIAAVKVKPTIKIIDLKTNMVQKTLDRESLREVQTPQVFEKEILAKAYERLGDKTPTDDAALAEALGVGVKVVDGDYCNIKITTPEDIVFAQGLLK
ncbi:MAG: 2-C-methyl-D-erythritol 4-phosphate cytidylyltransferase [Candidatus Aceula meridiana]|nr:2-C-methyl-D-erythritol 4-phosphate cytidylyltransferase [Candidatus Aceula meridiana]